MTSQLILAGNSIHESLHDLVDLAFAVSFSCLVKDNRSIIKASRTIPSQNLSDAGSLYKTVYYAGAEHLLPEE